MTLDVKNETIDKMLHLKHNEVKLFIFLVSLGDITGRVFCKRKTAMDKLGIKEPKTYYSARKALIENKFISIDEIRFNTYNINDKFVEIHETESL